MKELEKRLRRAMNTNDKAIKEWKVKFEEVPHYALSWGESLFLAVARQDLLQEVIGVIGRGNITMSGLHRILTQRLRVGVQNPNKSSHACSNLLDAHDVAALGWLLQMIDEPGL